MSEPTTTHDAVPFVDPAALAADPHGEVARWRALTPLIRTSDRRYLVLRAADVIALGQDPRTVQLDGADYVVINGIPDGAAADFLRSIFLLKNGEAHRRKRGPFAKTFAHGAMRALRPAVRAVAERIVAGMPQDEPFDFVDAVAARVPAEMIAAILGLPVNESAYFAKLVYRVAPILAPMYPVERHAEIDAAAAELRDYVTKAIEARRAAAGEDALSRVVEAADADPESDEIDLTHQLMGVILGGSDTTRSAFAMTVALLLQHPEQWAAVRADHDLIPGAIAEALRYEPSVGTAPRFAAEPIEIGGVTAPAGVMLALSTLSAMRDPALYADPERFDIRRTDHPRLHLVFGGGAHRCLGEALARLEMEEALRALTAVELGLLEAPRMLGSGGIRQITPMHVRRI